VERRQELGEEEQQGVEGRKRNVLSCELCRFCFYSDWHFFLPVRVGERKSRGEERRDWEKSGLGIDMKALFLVPFFSLEERRERRQL